MGKIRDALMCGYYDEAGNYTVEMDVEKLQQVVAENFEEFKGFSTNMETKIKLYDFLKEEFTKNLNPKCNQFIVDLIGEGEEE